MRKKIFIIALTCFALQNAFNLFGREVIEIEINGDKVIDGNRSDIFYPYLTRDESFVYIYSEKVLDNVIVTIYDATYCIVYEETLSISNNVEYAIPIETLSSGLYYINIVQGNGYDYLLGMFVK